MQTNLFETFDDSSEILSVSELTNKIKRVLETSFPPSGFEVKFQTLEHNQADTDILSLKTITVRLKPYFSRAIFKTLDIFRQMEMNVWHMVT